MLLLVSVPLVVLEAPKLSRKLSVPVPLEVTVLLPLCVVVPTCCCV